jgi:hypothetical protein
MSRNRTLPTLAALACAFGFQTGAALANPGDPGLRLDIPEAQEDEESTPSFDGMRLRQPVKTRIELKGPGYRYFDPRDEVKDVPPPGRPLIPEQPWVHYVPDPNQASGPSPSPLSEGPAAPRRLFQFEQAPPPEVGEKVREIPPESWRAEREAHDRYRRALRDFIDDKVGIDTVERAHDELKRARANSDRR